MPGRKIHLVCTKGKPMKILLADDHDLFRAGLGLVLHELGADNCATWVKVIFSPPERVKAIRLTQPIDSL